MRNVNVAVRNPEAEGIERIIAMEHMDPGELKVRRWASLEEGTTFTRRVKPGQTLFGKRRAYQRKVAYAEFDAICSGDIYTFEPEATEMLHEFLPFLVQSDEFFDYALGTSAGSLSPRTNWRDLARFTFDLPPLDEQRRIADLLWAVELAGTAASALATAAERAYVEARIALLKVGPLNDWRNAEWTPDEVDHWTEQVPNGWSAETIAAVGRVRAGATPNRSEQARYFDNGDIPWVKTLDLDESVLVETDERITAAAIAETSAVIVPSGTVLVAMYGGFGQIGRTARLGIDAATNQAVSAVLELREDVNPEYLHEVLKAGRQKWRKVAASSRKDPNITKGDVEAFDFPLPPPAQQGEVLAILCTLRRAIARIAAERDALRRLRSGLLAYFVGGR